MIQSQVCNPKYEFKTQVVKRNKSFLYSEDKRLYKIFHKIFYEKNNL